MKKFGSRIKNIPWGKSWHIDVAGIKISIRRDFNVTYDEQFVDRWVVEYDDRKVAEYECPSRATKKANKLITAEWRKYRIQWHHAMYSEFLAG